MKMDNILKNQLLYREIQNDVVKILCMVIHASNLFYVNYNDRERAERHKFQ